MDTNSEEHNIKEKVPNIIKDLIERFERHLSSYKGQGYNEAQLRQEFINPFFEALGWDVYNKSGAAPSYRDVIHEDSIKMSGGGAKAPDYCFTLSGRRMFFVETKKPSVDITKDAHPAYQLRRYAWSAELPLSILTNFEELAIYESRQRPKQDDKTNTERTLLITYKDYIEKWDEIASIFSKKAVLQGSFDRYIESAKKKRGTQEVDDEFLKEIEGWREALATNIAIRNSHLSVRELNDAVQKTIDRIIFLRMCEDRGIEQYGQLLSLLERENIYTHLCKIYEKADEKYNSGLFHFKKERERSTPPDEITLKLIIDDKVLKDIIKHIYYPESPYEFSVLRPEILGNVYEQFLGKVIRLTEGHRAKVEEKPEVKKAGGVYYTPEYIVDYIVKNTVGKLCEGKTPKQIEKLHILDPACGSGSFLLGAYSYLLTYHLNYYTNRKNPKSYKEQIYQRKDGQWFLTIKEKKRILLNNIYGVDIDSQAVEVTKLSLLLKVLEGAGRDIFEKQQKLWTERALPDLGNNIKCGNSLIGHDFYNSEQTKLIEDNEMMYRINAFDWKKEFENIMEKGRFDAVIGNPPYISVELTIKDVTEYYLKTYKSAYGRANSFSLFLEKALELTRDGGYCGLITSNRILTNTQLDKLRELLLKNSMIEHILTFKKTVFKAAVDTTVITFKNCIPTKKNTIEILYDINDLTKKNFSINKIHQNYFLENQRYVFNVKQQENLRDIIHKIKRTSVDLDQICDIKDGIILGEIKDLFLSTTKKDKRYEKWLEGNEVSRYHIEWLERYICYDPSLIEEELKRKHEKAKEKATTDLDFQKLSRSGIWLRNPKIFQQEKILTRQNAKRLIGVFDDNHYFVKNSLHCILLKNMNYNLKYILGFINSKLMNFYFQDKIGSTGEIFSQMKIIYLEKLPIHTIDFSNISDKSKHDKIVNLVDRILGLYNTLVKEKSSYEKTIIQRQIDATNQQIDRLVYELYGLNQKEIAIAEESLKK